MNSIKFTDLLKLPDEKFANLKLIFNSDWDYNPANFPEYVTKKLGDELRKFDLLGMYRRGELDVLKDSTRSHNPDNKRFRNGEYVVCFIPYGDKDWMLVNAFKVVDDSKILVDVDEAEMSEVSQYFGRLVITWERNTRNVRMKDKDAIEGLTVKTILEESYNEMAEEFPGYENVDLSWHDLNRVLKLKTWKTALENQKGVYLITDTATNKRYVGSATSDKGMLLSRWETYARNGHGGNKLLKSLVDKNSIDYISNNFRYSILEIFKSTIDDKIVLERESWWKKILLTDTRHYPDFGYNAN